jgi:hypothetical protein
MRRLPQNPFHPSNLPVLHAAYDQCFARESEAGSDEKLVYALCVGYLLTKSLLPEAKHMVSDDISLCNGDRKAMDRLVQLYINHVESTIDADYSIEVRVQSEKTRGKPPHPRRTLVSHRLKINLFSFLPRLSQCPRTTEPQNVL